MIDEFSRQGRPHRRNLIALKLRDKIWQRWSLPASGGLIRTVGARKAVTGFCQRLLAKLNPFGVSWPRNDLAEARGIRPFPDQARLADVRWRHGEGWLPRQAVALRDGERPPAAARGGASGGSGSAVLAAWGCAAAAASAAACFLAAASWFAVN